MDLDVINCQNQEELQKCFTKEYIYSLKKECGCIPWTLRTHQEVLMNVNFDLILLTYLRKMCAIKKINPVQNLSKSTKFMKTNVWFNAQDSLYQDSQNQTEMITLRIFSQLSSRSTINTNMPSLCDQLLRVDIILNYVFIYRYIYVNTF